VPQSLGFLFTEPNLKHSNLAHRGVHLFKLQVP
jgi:hypothetical protein